MPKIKMLIGFFAAIIISCYLYDDSPTAPKNVLSQKDSLAVRAILDANGLDTVKVRDVIYLKNSYIGEINLKSRSLNKFIFSLYLDSLTVSPSLNLNYNNIDTLILPDTISYGASIDVSNNKLNTIPDGINKIKGKIGLYLLYNNITSVSPNVLQCNVSYVNVNNNQLCSIPDSISQWISQKSRDSSWKATQNCP